MGLTRRRWVGTVLCGVGSTLVALAAPPVWAQDEVRLVLKGYDPVAYFTEGKPVKGDAQFFHDWDGGRYHFASAKHRDLFAAAPGRYAPQFGGYCTGAMSKGVRAEGNPEAWVIQDGKLFVFGQLRAKPAAEADPKFIESRAGTAAQHWREIRQKGGT
jgi:YHS domain-containing protein